MTFDLSSSVYIPATVSLLVAISTHQLTVWRERVAKQRALRLDYLLKSYRTLAKAIGHPRLYEMNSDFQEAIADIQFLGTVEQALMARTVAQVFGESGSVNLTPLMNLLRAELRREMGLREVLGGIKWIRIEQKNPKHSVFESQAD